jgi:NAD(P)-dependent dehydrogenase (short-subunit alcohol dehydrogenase family)
VAEAAAPRPVERVLVTGCSSGIGRATASGLAERGYEVVATARQVASIEDLDVALRLELDVMDDASVAAAVAAAGPIDVLVNNAGISVWGPIETVSFGQVQRIFDTNVLGCVRMVQALLPGMRERRRGAVVAISSAAGRTGGTPLIGWYSATKHALEVLTESLRYEVGHLGIRVVIIEPGAIDTNFPQNRVVEGFDVAPYDAMGVTFQQNIAAQRATAYPASMVADTVAEALASVNPPLRWYGSPDAEAIVTNRRSATDEEVEDMFRRSFGL